jgi:hypothetical protein
MAIKRDELMNLLRVSGVSITDRHMREVIKRLRRDGHLICSAAEEDGGYFMAATFAEFEEFDRLEFGAKIADMNETRNAMKRSAREVFGDAVQVSLF